MAAPAMAQMRFTLDTANAGLTHTFLPTGYPGMHGVMAGGACVLDVNDDGWLDLFVIGGGAGPDRLFVNDGDGTFTDRASAWGVDAVHRGGGCVAGDVNGDGLVDLFVVSMGDVGPGGGSGANPNDSKLYINRGDRFEEVADRAGVNRISTVTDGFGAAFGDYDLDGDLDLFVSAWFDADGGNRLLRNDAVGADGVPLFSWVNVELGVTTNRMRGFTPRFADMNDDRYPDLVLTSDFGSSMYFESVVGAGGYEGFVDRTLDAGVTADCNGMGSSVADIDNDGDLDWSITNIYYPPPSADVCGNVLYLNEIVDGRAVFVNAARDLGIADAGWAWGTSLSDLDNDGDLDVVAVSGWPAFTNKPWRLYEQTGDAALSKGASGGASMEFREVAQDAGFAFTGQGRGLTVFDADNDGDLDLFVVQSGAAARFYRNRTMDDGAAGHWLRVDVRTDAQPCLPPSGRHARVRVRVGESWQMRELDGSASYQGHGDPAAHFGLGAASVADEVRIEWSDGRVTIMQGVDADRTLIVNARHPLELDGMEGLTIFDLLELVRRFGEGDQSAELDLNGDGGVGIADLVRGVALLVDPCG